MGGEWLLLGYVSESTTPRNGDWNRNTTNKEKSVPGEENARAEGRAK